LVVLCIIYIVPSKPLRELSSCIYVLLLLLVAATNTSFMIDHCGKIRFVFCDQLSLSAMLLMSKHWVLVKLLVWFKL
jgi:hypothetical protein